METFELDTEAVPADTLSLLGAVAEDWGGRWQSNAWGGRLELPVRAGLRRGVVLGQVRVEAQPRGARIRFDTEEEHYSVHWQAVVILLFGAAGAVAAMLWPFYPQLLGLAPLGIVLSLAAWFLVASRLRSSGLEEFFDAVKREASAEPHPDER